MNLKMILALALLLNSSLMFSQEEQDKILMTIDDREITVGEFERYYKKNESAAGSQKPADEYIEHFINFKLKVIEAEELGYDTTEAFVQEFSGYREQLSKPYLTKKMDMEDLLKEAYNRAQFDLHVSHITIPCNPVAPTADTLAAFKMAVDTRQRVLDGENFDSVAQLMTDDTTTLASGGELGYITVFGLIYPLETVAYSTATGEISHPIRTEYGYHLIKINESRRSPGYIKLAHIMVYSPDTLTGQQKALAEWKIWAVHDSLVAGYSFGDLARRNSDDTQSAELGGELPYFKTGQILPEFHEMALTLNDPGEFTRPFRSPFGWHLIKLLDKKRIGNYESMRTEHTDLIKKNNRLTSSRLTMLDNMMKKYDFREVSSEMSVIFEIVDERIFDGSWTVPEDAELDGLLFTIGNQEYTLLDFARFLEENQDEPKMTERTLITRKILDFKEASLFTYEEEQLPVLYPEFKILLQEYHDGILLFNSTDEKVLSKAKEDKAGLNEFYKANMKEYVWMKRLDGIVISCEQKDVAEQAVALINTEENKDVSRASLIAKLCAPHYKSECIFYAEGIFEPGDNYLADKMNWDHRISEIHEQDGRFAFILKNNIIPPGQKSLDEAYGQVLTDYQEHIDQLWIKDLRKKYRVKVNRKLLSKMD